MNLKQLKEMIELAPEGKVFGYGLSEPFSWRGSYDEVAFRVEDEDMLRETLLDNIKKAYEKCFCGYKGGTYRYDDNTLVNFEEGNSCYTDGGYREDRIAALEDREHHFDREKYLVQLMLEN